MSKTRAWIFLILAILTEIIATSFLKISLGQIWGYILMGIFIIVSYYFMGLCVHVIPIGTAYAIWEALGVSLIALLGIFIFKEKLTLHQIIGISLGIIGIILINLGEKK